MIRTDRASKNRLLVFGPCFCSKVTGRGQGQAQRFCGQASPRMRVSKKSWHPSPASQRTRRGHPTSVPFAEGLQSPLVTAAGCSLLAHSPSPLYGTVLLATASSTRTNVLGPFSGTALVTHTPLCHSATEAGCEMTHHMKTLNRFAMWLRRLERYVGREPVFWGFAAEKHGGHTGCKSVPCTRWGCSRQPRATRSGG